jgi:hypothetical protein
MGTRPRDDSGAGARYWAPMPLVKALSYLFHGPAWLTFLAMGAATGGVALCTFDLFSIFRANYSLLTTYGAMAIFDGGLLQLVEIVSWGYLGVACYLVFKGCMDGLLARVPPRRPRS